MYPPLEPPAARKSSDEDLIQAINAREEDALAKLYERYRRLLGKIVAEILPAEFDVQETLQDVFTEVWRRADAFDPEKGKALGWLITMTRRRAIDRYRKMVRHAVGGEKLRKASAEVPGSVAGMDPEMSAVAIGGEAEATANDLRAFLAQAVRSLPAEQSQVVHLVYFEDLSQRAVAARTGLPLGTIKTRLELARRKLATRFEALRAEIQYAR